MGLPRPRKPSRITTVGLTTNYGIYAPGNNYFGASDVVCIHPDNIEPEVEPQIIKRKDENYQITCKGYKKNSLNRGVRQRCRNKIR